MADLRIGVIGYGLRVSLVAHAHRLGEGSAIVALCDPSPVAGSRFRERFGPDAPINA